MEHLKIDASHEGVDNYTLDFHDNKSVRERFKDVREKFKSPYMQQINVIWGFACSYYVSALRTGHIIDPIMKLFVYNPPEHLRNNKNFKSAKNSFLEFSKYRKNLIYNDPGVYKGKNKFDRFMELEKAIVEIIHKRFDKEMIETKVYYKLFPSVHKKSRPSPLIEHWTVNSILNEYCKNQNKPFSQVCDAIAEYLNLIRPIKSDFTKTKVENMYYHSLKSKKVQLKLKNLDPQETDFITLIEELVIGEKITRLN